MDNLNKKKNVFITLEDTSEESTTSLKDSSEKEYKASNNKEELIESIVDKAKEENDIASINSKEIDTKMELNICHLYPDLLNVYGDVGNILILKYRAEARGIKVNVINTSIKDDFNGDDMDIVFFGGGQDYEQSIVAEDLKSNKKDALKAYIEDGKVFLAICGGYQLLGKYYRAPGGEKLEGLGILDIYTEAGEKRFIGNTIIKNEEFNETYVGFENHSGRTYINNLKPLGKCIEGYGNNGEDGMEGCIYKNTFCTYFHGSLLSKNPELADRLLMLALEKKYDKEMVLFSFNSIPPLNDSLELKAKKVMIERKESNN